MKHLHSNKKLLDEYSGDHQLITYLGAITEKVSASGTVINKFSSRGTQVILRSQCEQVIWV